MKDTNLRIQESELTLIRTNLEKPQSRDIILQLLPTKPNVGGLETPKELINSDTEEAQFGD